MKALAKLSDEKIDLSDATEGRDWKDARRGLFYKPRKQQLTLRLDADVVAGFRHHVGTGYQAAINEPLREYVDKRPGGHE